MSELILVVEDEISLLETLVYNLTHQGYTVKTAADGEKAIQAARLFKPDLILLDIMLPILNGYEVCQVLRKETNSPIIFLTALDDELDRVLGLEIGGDDYIIKPFSIRELIARLRARLRMNRFRKEEDDPAESIERTVFGNLVINVSRHEVLLDGTPLSLKPKEYDLLVLMAKNRGRILTRQVLLQTLWGINIPLESRTIDVHVRWLRSKIEVNPSKPIRIVTVRGGGYRFEG